MTETRKTGSSAPGDELERLRELILGDKVTHIDALYRRVDDPETRTEDVAEVLPGAMHRVIEDPVARPKIEQPIVDTIRGAIKHDTESFAEALFPVLGPAIRRAVADALKSLVQRINVAIENSFSAKGLRWRLEAARSGVPFGQIVLRETMLYAVQEVFLIQHQSGLVLASARLDDTLVLDEDAFSGMLSAIQAFIQDSLGIAGSEQLRSAELGDRTLWVINGPGASLACLVIGTPPLEVREQLTDTLETLHAQFGDEFDWPPERLTDPNTVETLLRRALMGEVAEGGRKSSNRLSRLLWAAAGLAVIALLAWSAWHMVQTDRLEKRLTGLFAAQPGYVLTSHEASDGRISLAGLRDPLAETPESILQNTEIDSKLVTLAFRPFQSLETPFVLKRLSASLGGDGGFALDFSDNELTVGGSLTAAQYSMLETLPGLHPVIQSVNLEQTRLDPRDAVDLVRRRLNAPATVSITPVGDHMELSGSASAGWFAEAHTHSQLIGGWAIDFTPLRNALANRLDVLAGRLSGRTLTFTRQYEFSPAAQTGLGALGEELSELQKTATSLQVGLAIQLEGYADGLGLPEQNRQLALGRAEALRTELSSRGVDPAAIEIAVGVWESGDVNPNQRKVVVNVLRDPLN